MRYFEKIAVRVGKPSKEDLYIGDKNKVSRKFKDIKTRISNATDEFMYGRKRHYMPSGYESTGLSQDAVRNLSSKNPAKLEKIKQVAEGTNILPSSGNVHSMPIINPTPRKELREVFHGSGVSKDVKLPAESSIKSVLGEQGGRPGNSTPIKEIAQETSGQRVGSRPTIKPEILRGDSHSNFWQSPVTGNKEIGNRPGDASKLRNILQQKDTINKWTRGSLIGAGTVGGAAVGSMLNSEDSAVGTLIGAGAGGVGTAFATGGPSGTSGILSKGLGIYRKLRNR